MENKNIIQTILSIFSKKKQVRADVEDVLRCPNCNNDKWIEGPGGGSFGNIKCGNCKTRYNNMGPFGLHKIPNTI